MCNEAARSAKKPGSGEWRNGSRWNRPSDHEEGRKDSKTKTSDPFSFLSAMAFRSSAWC